MFLSNSQIIEFFDSLINQIDIFYEKNSQNSNNELNCRSQIIKKINEMKQFNLKICNGEYRYCYFFGKIDNLFLKFKTMKEIDLEVKSGLLLITNDMICNEIYEKLR